MVRYMYQPAQSDDIFLKVGTPKLKYGPLLKVSVTFYIISITSVKEVTHRTIYMLLWKLVRRGRSNSKSQALFDLTLSKRHSRKHFFSFFCQYLTREH